MDKFSHDQDKPLRSIIKAVSYRIFGTLNTIIISYLVTGKIPISLSIGGLELFTKILLYYIHERLWGQIPFGKQKKMVVSSQENNKN